MSEYTTQKGLTPGGIRLVGDPVGVSACPAAASQRIPTGCSEAPIILPPLINRPSSRVPFAETYRGRFAELHDNGMRLVEEPPEALEDLVTKLNAVEDAALRLADAMPDFRMQADVEQDPNPTVAGPKSHELLEPRAARHAVLSPLLL